MSRFAVASVKYFCLHPPFPARLITQIINRANLDFKKVETYLNKFAALPLLIRILQKSKCVPFSSIHVFLHSDPNFKLEKMQNNGISSMQSMVG